LAEASAALRGLKLSIGYMDDDAKPDEGELTAEEIRRVIELERGRPVMPRFDPEPPRERRRRGRRGRRPSVPSRRDLLDFLESGP